MQKKWTELSAEKMIKLSLGLSFVLFLLSLVLRQIYETYLESLYNHYIATDIETRKQLRYFTFSIYALVAFSTIFLSLGATVKIIRETKPAVAPLITIAAAILAFVLMFSPYYLPFAAVFIGATAYFLQSYYEPLYRFGNKKVKVEIYLAKPKNVTLAIILGIILVIAGLTTILFGLSEDEETLVISLIIGILVISGGIGLIKKARNRYKAYIHGDISYILDLESGRKKRDTLLMAMGVLALFIIYYALYYIAVMILIEGLTEGQHHEVYAPYDIYVPLYLPAGVILVTFIVLYLLLIPDELYLPKVFDELNYSCYLLVKEKYKSKIAGLLKYIGVLLSFIGIVTILFADISLGIIFLAPGAAMIVLGLALNLYRIKSMPYPEYKPRFLSSELSDKVLVSLSMVFPLMYIAYFIELYRRGVDPIIMLALNTVLVLVPVILVFLIIRRALRKGFLMGKISPYCELILKDPKLELVKTRQTIKIEGLRGGRLGNALINMQVRALMPLLIALSFVIPLSVFSIIASIALYVQHSDQPISYRGMLKLLFIPSGPIGAPSISWTLIPFLIGAYLLYKLAKSIESTPDKPEELPDEFIRVIRL